jgi:GNAT superfamily N-acetyltransferase
MKTLKERRLSPGDVPAQTSRPRIRRARPDEATALSELAFRAKAHWGYDAEFMAACRNDLTMTAEDIVSSMVYVAVDDESVAGFYCLHVHDGGEAELDDLFVEPSAMGQGVGQRLWQHAVTTAQQHGCYQLMLQSDPHAEGFYRAMGAERCGDSESTVTPGRMLPLMCVSLR